MGEENEIPLKDLEGTEDVEDSVLEDDEDDLSGGFTQKLYSYYSFPEEEPMSIRFKGKKPVFVKSVETLNDLLKRGEEGCVNNVTFKVLDDRKMPHGMEYDVVSTKNKERGVSVLKIYGPNQKKGCTIMICKSREHEKKFVSILGNDIIKHLLDNFGLRGSRASKSSVFLAAHNLRVKSSDIKIRKPTLPWLSAK